MENLEIKETKYTPEVILDSKNGEFLIKGHSYPENTMEFYEPIIEWLESYFKESSNVKSVLNIEIIYFNSSSSRVFFEIFDLIEELDKKFVVEINWIYDEENESVFEIGEDYKLDFPDLKFNLLKKE